MENALESVRQIHAEGTEEYESLRRAFDDRHKRLGDDECWLWTGHIGRNGYGSLAVRKGFTFLAHRISWYFHYGFDPVPQCVLHRCDVKNCVNPHHLWLGTKADNNWDRIKKGRSWTQLNPDKSHFVIHPEDRCNQVGEDHWKAKLTETQVREILAEPQRYGMLAELGRKYGVAYQTIRVIRRREIWRHIK